MLAMLTPVAVKHPAKFAVVTQYQHILCIAKLGGKGKVKTARDQDGLLRILVDHNNFIVSGRMLGVGEDWQACFKQRLQGRRLHRISLLSICDYLDIET